MLNLLASLSPRVLLLGFALLGVLLALPLELAGLRRLRRAQIARGTLLLLLGAAVVLLGVLAAVVAASLHSYSRLTREHEAAHVVMRALGPKDFVLTLSIPGAAPHQYELRGDEWQIDARVLKWRAIGTIVGFDTVYRLERISGRYADAQEELSAQRTVYSLWHNPRLDLWQLARQYHDYLPFADALYGSAAYVPMADGAEYVVTVSASGLIVRPDNDAARHAIGDWH